MKVLIIGAGISGLSVGIYLQKNGFETEIIEKHSLPGGLCTSWKKGDFIIDGCAHWILGSAPGSSFYKVFNELIDMNSVPFYNHDVRMVIELKSNRNKYGSKEFKLYTSLNQLYNYLIDLAPEDKKIIASFIGDMKKMQRFDLPPIPEKKPFLQATVEGIKMSRYIHFLPILWKWGRMTNQDFASRLKNPFLKEAFQLLFDHETVNMLVLMMPLSFFDLKSCGYPIGGSYQFAKRFEQRYLELGGKLQYKKYVKEIQIKNDTATGIVIRDGSVLAADIVVSTADWKLTHVEFLKRNYLVPKLEALEQQKLLNVFYSVVQVSFGVNMNMKDYPHFFRYPLEESVQSPDGTVYDRMEVHLYHYDPSMAPSGKTTLVVSFYTLNREFWIQLRNENRKEYRRVKNEFIQLIEHKLSLRFGGNFSTLIEMTDMATPATILRYTGNWLGSTQGWLPGKNLIASSPVKYTLPGLKNFYYASHWNQPGGGIPVAVLGAREVSQRICKHQKLKFRTR